MAKLEKIKSSEDSRWPFNLKIMDIVSVTDEMRKWLVEAHGHGDVYYDADKELWYSNATDEPDNYKDIVYFLWGPGYVQFKHEEDMIAFVLRFSG